MPRYFLILVLLLAACLAAAPAYAGCSNPTGNEADRIYNSDYQTLQFCNGTNWVPFGAYNAYVGPGDIVSGATAWYGLRAYSAAIAATGTQKAINIRRASDNTTKDILIRKSGNLDTPTASTFCASTTCYVTKWYDQSGNGLNNSQGTAADQPQLVFNCIGSLPCLTFNGSTQYTAYVGGGGFSAPFTFSAVAERTGVFTTGIIINTQVAEFGFAAANTVSLYGTAGSSCAVTASDSNAHAIQAVINGSPSYINVDNTITNCASFVNGSADNHLYIGVNYVASGQYLTGDIMETGMWSSVLSAAVQSSLCHNQYTYWGTSTAC